MGQIDKWGQRLTYGVGGYLAYKLFYDLKNQKDNQPSHTFKLDESQDGFPNDFDWVSEKNYQTKMDQQVLPYVQNYLISNQIPISNFNLHYDFYLKKEEFPTIIFTHGFIENKEKYFEIIYYLLQLNCNVLIYDVRGHGDSKVNAKDTRVDIDFFDQFVNDLYRLIDHAKQTYHFTGPCYLMGHSMGGMISMRYAKQYPETIQGVILSSPMLAINTRPFSAAFASLLSKTLKLSGQGHRAIPFQDMIVPAVFSKDQSDELTLMPKMSYSQVRINYMQKISRKFEVNPTIGGTLSWLASSMAASEQMLQLNYYDSIHIPVLIFMSQGDDLVDIRAIDHALNHLYLGYGYEYEHTGHNLLHEKDAVIQDIIRKVNCFIDSHS